MEALKAGAVIGGIFGLFLAFIVVCLILGGLFLWIAARLAKIRKSSFLWCMVVSVICGFVNFFVSGLLSIIPLIGTILGMILSILASVKIMEAMFETTLEKACLCWVFHYVAVWLSIGAAFIITAGGLTAMAVIFGR